MSDSIERTEELNLNIGPQHPSTHGVFRMIVRLEGEYIRNIDPKLGYLHRGLEKLAEGRTYTQFIPYTDRLDYIAAAHNNLGYVQTVEKLMDLEIPERAEYLRVIFAELARISSHLLMIGSMAIDMAGITAWGYCFRDRERVLDLFEMTAGNRLTVNYMRIGGVSQDPPPEFWPALQSFLKDLPGMIAEYEGIFFGNEIVKKRLKGVAVLSKEMAMAYGVTGPILRASGVKRDLRQDEPYGIYNRFDFEVPTLQNGDSYDRVLLRLLEIKESARLIEQAMRDIPEGSVMAKVPKLIKPPAGETYHKVENPKGELGFYLVSDGSPKPRRLRIRAGAFVNLQVFEPISVNTLLQDVIATFATFDAVMGEIDK